VESAGKPDALQTLREVPGARPLRGSVWSAWSLLPLLHAVQGENLSTHFAPAEVDLGSGEGEAFALGSGGATYGGLVMAPGAVSLRFGGISALTSPMAQRKAPVRMS